VELELRRYSSQNSTEYIDFKVRLQLKKQIWFFCGERKFG
jgi:hypothetical protein